MSEETKKNWWKNIASAIVGLIIGIASMFGINQSDLADLKGNVEKAYSQIKSVKIALDNKQYLDAIDAAKKAIAEMEDLIQKAKDAAAIAQDSIDEYKAVAAEIKAAAEAKDYKKVVALSTDIIEKINQAVPADKLTGKVKQLHDLITQIIADAKEEKYEPTIDAIEKLIALFKKEEAKAE